MRYEREISTSPIFDASTIGHDESPICGLLRWGREVGVEYPLRLLLAATQSHREPHFVGSVLAYLRDPQVTQLLHDWEDELSFASALAEFSGACAITPWLLESFPPLPPAHSVARQLQDGELSQYPLVALIARPVPQGRERDGADQEWIATLRAWCVFQFLEIVGDGLSPSTYLLRVVRSLRMAIDQTDSPWWPLFCSLRGPTNSIHGLTSHLALATHSLLAGIQRPERPSHRSTIRQLERFCRGEQSQERSSSHVQDYSFYTDHVRDRTSSWPDFQTLPELGLAGASTDINPVVLPFDLPDDESSAIIPVEVEETQTPAEQEIAATGVLLASAEEHQFLRFSWDRPNHEEKLALFGWIDRTLDDPAHKMRHLACLAWIAMHTGYSLRTVLNVELSPEPGPDWRVDVAAGEVHRLPPKRYNGWTPNADARSWIQMRANRIAIRLPDQIHEILSEQAPAPERESTHTLATTLWRDQCSRPERAFREACQTSPGLERLSSGMLANGLTQSCFEQTQDSALAQLLASHPRTGLPGICAYPSYPSQVLQSMSPVIAAATPSQDDALIGAGSELVPIEQMLRDEIGRACQTIRALAEDPAQWRAHHNALSTFMVTALLAATGARPVRSPFHAVSHFDLDGHPLPDGRQCPYLYIADKVSGEARQGRIVPLASNAAAWIRDIYLPHLERVGRLLIPIDRDFGEACLSIAGGVDCPHLPLFFLLGDDRNLDWSEVSEASMVAVRVFRWPLPANLFRHRLVAQLRRRGLDEDIVMGIAGHAMHGRAPYGHISPRTWKKDAVQALPVLDRLFDELFTEPPAAAAWPQNAATRLPSGTASSALNRRRVFGPEQRRLKRELAHQRAVATAKDEIQAFVGTRPIGTVTPQEWDILSRQMLTRENGMPQALASIRYDTLRRWILERWNETGEAARLGRRYVMPTTEMSPFTSVAIGAPTHLRNAQDLLNRALTRITISRTAYRDCLALGLGAVLLLSRVADAAILKDIARKKNFRLVHYSGRFYLEHAKNLENDPAAACKRFRIHNNAAALLAKARSTSKRVDLATRLAPDALPRPPHAEKQLSVNCWVAAWLPIVDQANQLELPGTVAGYLSGQLATVALDHQDWLRAARGVAIRAPRLGIAEPAGQTAEGLDDAEPPDPDRYSFLQEAFAVTSKPREVDGPGTNDALPPERQAQRRAHDFFAEVRTILRQAAKQRHSPRKQLDARLRQLIANSPQVSSSCRLLAEWLRFLAQRKHKGRFIAISSLQRYVNALSGCFIAVAYATDLQTCSTAGLTQLYVDLMETRRMIRPHSAKREQTDEDQGEDDAVYRTWGLAFNLLREFHRFVRTGLGIDDPDWAEITRADGMTSVRPGYLLQREYQYLLAQLAPAPERADRETLAVAFLLLCAFRFGLRRSEALGLRRSDWIDAENQLLVILVRGHAQRRLKTRAGQRQVPLLFPLHPVELVVVERFLRGWEAISQGDTSTPLFVDQYGQPMSARALTQRARQAIKHATGNDTSSLHALRHTFANRALRLLNESTNCWSAGEAPKNDHELALSAKKLMLGTDTTTTRSSWAVARLLGHAHPETSFRNYVHLVPDQAEQLIWHSREAEVAQASIPEGVLDLDIVPRVDGYLANPLKTSVSCDPTPVDYLRALQVWHRSGVVEDAAFTVGIDVAQLQPLTHLIEAADQTLDSKPKLNRRKSGQSNLLGHILPHRWDFLSNLLSSSQLSEVVIDTKLLPEDLASWIGATRQLLIYRPDDFVLIPRILNLLGYVAADYGFYLSKGCDPRIVELAKTTGIPALQHEGGVKPIQLDVLRVGDPPLIVKDKAVLVIPAKYLPPLRSSYELALTILLCAFYIITQKTRSELPGADGYSTEMCRDFDPTPGDAGHASSPKDS